MPIMSIHPTWNSLIDPLWVEALDQTPFLTRCRKGLASRAELYSFVRQQFHYSRHFTRYLCALLTNITDDADRLSLTQNLFEEMGLGIGVKQTLPHATLYRNMMASMGVRPTDAGEHPATSQLIATMFECCANPNPMVGLAALGLGAEAIVPHVYSQVIMGFQAIGQSAEELEFFHIHVAGDDEHAVTMRNIIDREIGRDPAQRSVVRDTAKKVILARARFFEQITMKVNDVADVHGGSRAVLQL